MATPSQIEANQRNAQKSTGPRTAEGKDRSRFNAVKHGMTARNDVLPGEDSEAFAARVDAWIGDLRPRSGVECYLAERAARVSWQLDRIESAHVARLSSQIQRAGIAEAQQTEDDIARLGWRLFWDARGPMAMYPHSPCEDVPPGQPQVSWSGDVDDPNNPALIVPRLESTAAGCQWLLARWAELGSILAREHVWQSPEKLRAIRLLGRQPVDAFVDPSVAGVFLACHAIDPRGGELFHEIYTELSPDEIAMVRQRLESRPLDSLRPQDAAAAREALSQIVEQAVTRLATKAAAHRQQAAVDASLAASRLAFDDSDAGERLRRHESTCGRTLLRTLDILAKIRRAGTAGESAPAADAGGPTPVVFQPVEPLTPASPAAKSSTESPPPAKFEISQNEPNFVNIDRVKALNGDHREDRGLDLEAGRRAGVRGRAEGGAVGRQAAN